MAIDRASATDRASWTQEERDLAERFTRESWAKDGDPEDTYRTHDFDRMADHVEPDLICAPAYRHALWSRVEQREYYVKRMADYEMNVITEIDTVDIVGDLAIVTGTFRLTRRPEQGVHGLDHAGRHLGVYKRGEDGEWRVWRNMDTPSPDADHFYDRLERGW